MRHKQFMKLFGVTLPSQIPHSLETIGVNINDIKMIEYNKPFKKYELIFSFLLPFFQPIVSQIF